MALLSALFISVAPVLPVHSQVLSQAGINHPPAPAGTQAAPAAIVKPDPRKAKQAYEQGLLAEKQQDPSAAFENYSDAVRYAPDNQKYLLSRELARSRLVEMRMDAAERDAISGKFQDAERELAAAHSLDPTNSIVSDRLAEISSLDHAQAPQIPAERSLAGEVHLAYQTGKRSFDYRGDTRGAYEEVARQFGVEVAFDEDLRSKSVRFRVEEVDFREAMRILGDMNGTFWQPLTRRLFFVAESTSQKRRDYEASVVRTLVLPASDTADQMTQVARVVRDIAGITRSELNVTAHTLTVRASPRAIAIASDLVDTLEQPLSELVLEIEVLEVDRNVAHTLGITPPQTAHVYSINSQEVQQAEQSASGLLGVLEQIFGTPSSISGLTSAQIQAEITSGQINASSLFPFIVFGGGLTTFLATPPGAAANLSEMLSLVQHGRRILLRAEDGQPATFFVGERYPIALGAYSPNLAASGVASISSSSFPIKDYPTGKSPSFVATASLRNNGINDLIVANSGDNSISVFFGNPSASSGSTGDGTFATPIVTPLPSGDTDPVWIATGVFDNLQPFNVPLGHAKRIDLATANASSNSVSILIPHADIHGDLDGTFTSIQTLMTGTGTTPVSVVAGDFNEDGNLDLAVANQGNNTIDIFFGNGDGTFQISPEVITLPTGFQPTALATGIFDTTSSAPTKGHLDLAVAEKGNNSVSIFLGNGDGTFQPEVDYSVGKSPVWVSTADLNAANDSSGNAILDLAVANNTDNSVSVLIGNGNGAFGTAVNYPAGNGPTSIAAAPFALSVNSSGATIDDLAVTDQTDNAISILFNTPSSPGTFDQTSTGSGSLNQELSLSHDTNPLSIVTADFNGDTRPDAAVVENGTDELSVILNELNFSNSSGNLVSNSPFGAIPSIQYEDIGLKIKATPRVHPDGDVTLKLDTEISSLTSLSNNGNPVINNDSVEQTVRVKENEPAILAGILEPQVTSAINGTPGLADLPGIGWLGKNQNTQVQDTELLILITPRILQLSPRKDRVIYAGEGAPEGARGDTSALQETPVISAPPGQGAQPPSQAPAQPQNPGYRPGGGPQR